MKSEFLSHCVRKTLQTRKGVVIYGSWRYLYELVLYTRTYIYRNIQHTLDSHFLPYVLIFLKYIHRYVDGEINIMYTSAWVSTHTYLCILYTERI